MEMLTRVNQLVVLITETERLIREMEKCIERLNYYTDRGIRILYDNNSNLSIDVPANITDDDVVMEQVAMIDIEIMNLRQSLTPHIARITPLLNDLNVLPNIEILPEGMINSIRKFSELLEKYQTVEHTLNNVYQKD